MYDAMGIKYSDEALRETPCVELEGQAKEEAKEKEEYGYVTVPSELEQAQVRAPPPEAP